MEKLQRGETSAISEVALGSLSHSLTIIFTESLTSYIYITWIISSLGHSLHTTTKTKSPASPLYADKSILQVLFKNYKSCLSFQKEKQRLYAKLHGIIKTFWFTSGHSAACLEKQVVWKTVCTYFSGLLIPERTRKKPISFPLQRLPIKLIIQKVIPFEPIRIKNFNSKVVFKAVGYQGPQGGHSTCLTWVLWLNLGIPFY